MRRKRDMRGEKTPQSEMWASLGDLNTPRHYRTSLFAVILLGFMLAVGGMALLDSYGPWEALLKTMGGWAMLAAFIFAVVFTACVMPMIRHYEHRRDARRRANGLPETKQRDSTLTLLVAIGLFGVLTVWGVVRQWRTDGSLEYLFSYGWMMLAVAGYCVVALWKRFRKR